MGIGEDKVQVYKTESTALGGKDEDAGVYDGPVPINAQQDAIESAGGYVQDAENRDENVKWYRDGDNFMFKDVSTGPHSLTDLAAAGSGISAAQHKALRQLIHFLSEGPADGFASAAYKETTGTVFPTSIIWWESSSKEQKIVERSITWSGVNVTVDEWKMYDTDGATLLVTVSDAISYSGVFETTRTRTITVH